MAPLTNIPLVVSSMISMGIFGVFLFLIFAGVGIFLFVFWILMIVDCVQRKFKNDNDKLVWILVLIFLHVLGALIYYFVVKRK